MPLLAKSQQTGQMTNYLLKIMIFVLIRMLDTFSSSPAQHFQSFFHLASQWQHSSSSVEALMTYLYLSHSLSLSPTQVISFSMVSNSQGSNNYIQILISVVGTEWWIKILHSFSFPGPSYYLIASPYPLHHPPCATEQIAMTNYCHSPSHERGLDTRCGFVQKGVEKTGGRWRLKHTKWTLCACVWISITLWGQKFVYTATLWGLTFLMEIKNRSQESK